MKTTEKKIFGTLHPFFESGAIMGRLVANENYFKALVAKDYFDEYHFFLSNGSRVQELRQKIAQVFPEQSGKGIFKIFLRRELPKLLKEVEYFCFHFSDAPTEQVWLTQLRNVYSKNIFPVTSITHSLSYANYPWHFVRHIWQGCSQRDAIAATSIAGHDVVANFMRILKSNYDVGFPSPQIPIIPLAADTPEVTAKKKAQAKKHICKKLELHKKSIVYLVFARLSHHSKMDPLPLLRAFIVAHNKGLSDIPYALVMAGFAEQDDEVLAIMQKMADQAGVVLKFCYSPSEEEKQELYLAADVFCSMVDNIQETFGLTVAEAASYGLPAVVSDYNGYKDIVVHEKTGFLIPTIAADFAEEYALLAMIEPDSHYHLTLAQQTAFDMEKMADALVRLGLSEELRQSMGQNAAKHFKTNFSWQAVMQKWVELWENLWKNPVDVETLRVARHPLLMDFAQIFAKYPSRILDPAITVQITEHGNAVYHGEVAHTVYHGVSQYMPVAIFRHLLFLVRKPVTMQAISDNLAEKFPEYTHTAMLVVWCLKHYVLQIVEQD